MKNFLLFFLLFSTANWVQAQVGLGFVLGGDTYNWYKNPEISGETALRSSGGALLSGSIGPKIWLGGQKFSLSVEGQANIGLLTFDLQEYKGMGSLALPLLAKLNFGALSSFAEPERFRFGLSIGGGIQYTRTELYGLSAAFRDNTTRSLFRTYVAEIGIGRASLNGFLTTFYARFGIGENGARTFNIGSASEINFKTFSKALKGLKQNEREEEQIQSFM